MEINKLKKYICSVLCAFLILSCTALAAEIKLADGDYEVELELEGGSGKATVDANSSMVVEDGKATVKVTWSSPNYDYMVVDGTTYYPINNGEGNSVFEIPVLAINEGYSVIGDTVAMSKPHEIEYTLIVKFDEKDSSNMAVYAAAFLLLVGIVALQAKRAKKNFFDNNENEANE